MLTSAASAPARPGCVYPDYLWSTMVYSLSGPYPELAAHIMEAQLSGLPGAYPGYGPNTEPLHRIQAPLLVERNRDTACPLERDGGSRRRRRRSCCRRTARTPRPSIRRDRS